MRLLDRYVLAEWLKVFGLALAATLAVLLLQDLYSNLGDLLNEGARPGQVLFYYAVLLPSFLPVVLPLSQYVSLNFALGNLHRHHEITALRAAGLSLWRIAASLWAGAVVLAVLLWWLNASIVPWSVEQSHTFRDNLRNSAESKTHAADDIAVIPQLTYDNPAQHRRWFINHFSDYAYRGHGISIYELDARGRDHRQILAREGYFDDASGHWVLLSGREILFDPVEAEPIRSLPFDRKEYPEFTETPRLMETLRQRPDDLSLAQLRAALAQAPAADNPALQGYATRYYAILASPFVCLIVVGLAVPYAVSGVRVNPMVGVSKSVGWLFVYYVIVNLFTILSNQHQLGPVTAAWLPNILLLGLAVWLFRRAA
jgi:lipopolysaccharide export system permease protein